MTVTVPPYEPEEYPRCQKCGRLAFHSRATLCCLCLVDARPTPRKEGNPR